MNVNSAEQFVELMQQTQSLPGLKSKADIHAIAEILVNSYPTEYPNGDDAAVLSNSNADNGYDLLAIEGFLPEFVSQDPWFAGWCAVMVNISDITAMGGRPSAVVNAYWGGNDELAQQVFAGMSAASQAFQLPIVGGHTNLNQADQPILAAAILGKAKRVLHSFSAKPGQQLIAAIDLRGQYRAPFNNWNAATAAPAARVRNDLALLPMLAEQNLVHAAKDISQAGVLGTTVMMMESAQVGAHVMLEKIPKPDQIEWLQWLNSFPSFGYLLTAEPHDTEDILTAFQQRDISAAVIGEINDSQRLTVSSETKHSTPFLFWDLKKNPLMGFGRVSESCFLKESICA